MGILSYRPQTATIVASLQQLGLGALVKLTAAEIADRFGEPGTTARRLALGYDTRLPGPARRRPAHGVNAAWRANSGLLLERTLEVLVDRLLARSQRRGRTVRAITLSARLAERGTWREEVAFRQALSDPRRIRLALSQRLQLLPAPAIALQLAVKEFGPAGGDQGGLLNGERTARLARLQDAVGQVRTLAGQNAALRVLVVDPRSRVPERKVLYALGNNDPTHNRQARRAERPQPAKVRAEHGRPVAIAGVHVDEVREFWIVEDRWWDEQPIHRHYWELITVQGRNVVVFHDLVVDRWFSQTA